jgi:hypothetical protein
MPLLHQFLSWYVRACSQAKLSVAAHDLLLTDFFCDALASHIPADVQHLIGVLQNGSEKETSGKALKCHERSVRRTIKNSPAFN